jgi:iron-sulfur cluster assembly accessory protein
LTNTARTFGKKHELEIHNKKYTDDGKLLTMDISERAMAKLNEIAKEEGNPDVALRISVESGGCHGFQYNLELSDLSKKEQGDCVFEKNGARVMIDEASLSILRESMVDYTTELIGSMFKVVDSPYMASSCGCGSSFDFDFSKV